MTKSAKTNSLQRVAIRYFDGVNGEVQQSIASRTELSHAENARSPMIGVLEKREGQTVVGTNVTTATFLSKGNYGLTYFNDGGTLSLGPIRISSIDGLVANIYYLNTDNEWTLIDDTNAKNLSLTNHKFVNIDDNLLIVNGIDSNRMIVGAISSSTSIITAGNIGSLYNSPKAKIATFYKDRIYLADYFNDSGVELKTTVLRSSYPMGIISLLNEDVSDYDHDTGLWTLPIVDTKYFYSDTGMNEYEIYRGNTKIATITINNVLEDSITAENASVVFETGFSSFLAVDEVWISGTFTGEKQYRWISNSDIAGRDIKQYDTFKLTGGDEDAITMMVPVGNVLMIANKNSLMTWNNYSLENFDLGIGCSSSNGYVKKGKLYFIHYTGFYSTGGGVPELLSRKVERYIKGATKEGIENAAVGVKGLSIFCTIGDVTLYKEDGSLWKVLPQVCLEYATIDQNWYVHTNVTASAFKSYIASDGAEKLLIASLTKATEDVLSHNLISNEGFSEDEDWVYNGNWEYTGTSMQIINT